MKLSVQDKRGRVIKQMVQESDIRVCRIAEDYPVGGKPSYGLQPVFHYLSKEQARLGYDVQVIARKHGSQPSFEYQDGIKISRVETPFTVNAFQKLANLSKGHDSTVAHLHSTSGLFMAPLKRIVGIPVVSHVHGSTRSRAMPVVLKFGDVSNEFSFRRVWYSYARERILWKSADAIVSVCGAIKKDLMTYYDISGEKIRVVYNGVDAEAFREIPNPELPGQIKGLEGKRIVLYVGHFGLRKGVIFLIRAMKKVVAEVPDSVLVCVGGVPSWLGKADYWSFLRRTIDENGLRGKVFLLDRVANSELPSYYSNASVFVLASYYEAMPKVLLEAMSCSRPVVVTKPGGPEEAIESGVSGLLVSYGSSDEIADAVIRILRDDKAARQMGLKARERIEKDFTWNVVARRIGEVYDELLKKA